MQYKKVNNIIQLPIFRFSKKVISKKDIIWEKNKIEGAIFNRTDYEIYNCILAMAEQDELTTKQIRIMLNLKNGSSNTRIRNSIEKMAKSELTFHNCMIENEIVKTPLLNCKIIGKGSGLRFKHSHPTIFSDYYEAGKFQILDWNTYLRLPSGLPRRMYEFLEKKKNQYKGHFKINDDAWSFWLPIYGKSPSNRLQTITDASEKLITAGWKCKVNVSYEYSYEDPAKVQRAELSEQNGKVRYAGLDNENVLRVEQNGKVRNSELSERSTTSQNQNIGNGYENVTASKMDTGQTHEPYQQQNMQQERIEPCQNQNVQKDYYTESSCVKKQNNYPSQSTNQQRINVSEESYCGQTNTQTSGNPGMEIATPSSGENQGQENGRITPDDFAKSDKTTTYIEQTKSREELYNEIVNNYDDNIQQRKKDWDKNQRIRRGDISKQDLMEAVPEEHRTKQKIINLINNNSDHMQLMAYIQFANRTCKSNYPRYLDMAFTQGWEI